MPFRKSRLGSTFSTMVKRVLKKNVPSRFSGYRRRSVRKVKYSAYKPYSKRGGYKPYNRKKVYRRSRY